MAAYGSEDGSLLVDAVGDPGAGLAWRAGGDGPSQTALPGPFVSAAQVAPALHSLLLSYSYSYSYFLFLFLLLLL